MMRTLIMASTIVAAAAFPAIAQTTTAPLPSPPVAAAPSVAPLMLTAEDAKNWIDKSVYSSDGKKIGEVVAFARGSDNKVTEMHADIGGFLGIGETRVRLLPTQFKLEGDRAVLNVTAAQAKDLPKVQK